MQGAVLRSFFAGQDVLDALPEDEESESQSGARPSEVDVRQVDRAKAFAVIGRFFGRRRRPAGDR